MKDEIVDFGKRSMCYQARKEWESEAEDKHPGWHKKEVVKRTVAKVHRDYTEKVTWKKIGKMMLR